MNEDQIRGAANTIGGRVQRAAGALGGDHGLEAEGAIRETAGRVQAKAGEAVDTARDVIAHRGEVHRTVRIRRAAVALHFYHDHAPRLR